jgi:hypothetical protein
VAADLLWLDPQRWPPARTCRHTHTIQTGNQALAVTSQLCSHMLDACCRCIIVVPELPLGMVHSPKRMSCTHNRVEHRHALEHRCAVISQCHGKAVRPDDQQKREKRNTHRKKAVSPPSQGGSRQTSQASCKGCLHASVSVSLPQRDTCTVVLTGSALNNSDSEAISCCLAEAVDRRLSGRDRSGHAGQWCHAITRLHSASHTDPSVAVDCVRDC